MHFEEKYVILQYYSVTMFCTRGGMCMNYPVINLAETGKRIKWLRKRSGYSVSELQEFFGLEHPNAIYKWQKGESLPTVDNLLALSVIFKISMNDILVFDDQDFCLSKYIFNIFKPQV